VSLHTVIHRRIHLLYRQAPAEPEYIRVVRPVRLWWAQICCIRLKDVRTTRIAAMELELHISEEGNASEDLISSSNNLFTRPLRFSTRQSKSVERDIIGKILQYVSRIKCEM